MFRKVINKYERFPVQVRASFWFLICAFFQKGISFITTPIFTRLLSTTEYGQYNVFNSWLGILAVLITLNLYGGVYTSGLVKYEKRRNEFSSSLQGLTLSLVIVWTLVYLLFREFWNKIFTLTTIQMLLMLLLMWTTAVFSFWSMEQRVDFKYKKLVVITVLVSIAKPLVGILLVLVSRDKVTARIIGLAGVELVFYLWFFFSQMKRGKTFFSWTIWKYALAFNIPLIPHYLSTSILNSADRIMIGRMVNDSSAGIYSLAYSISMIMTMFNTALMQTIEPWLYKKIKDNQICEISEVAYPAFMLIAIANAILIAFAPEAVAIFAPPEYYDAIYIIPPAAMSVYFMFSYAFFAVFEFYYGKTKQIALATTGGALLNIVLNYIFIKIFGYYAAGYTTLVCYIIYALFHYISMRTICKTNFEDKQPYNIRIYVMIAMLFMGIGFMFLMTYKAPIIRYALIAIMAVAIVIKKETLIAKVREIMSLRKSNS